MDEIQQLKNELREIKERNKRVELDKAWETSTFRKVLVGVLTYAVIVLFFIVLDFPKPFVSAIVPTIGFILSTLSIPFFKNYWLNSRKQE